MKTRTASRLRNDDSGLSLIEVIVALMIFGIVAIGVAYSLTNILTITKDARSRTVAANLAAQYIDNARSFEDVFKVVSQGDANDDPSASNQPFASTEVDGTMYYVYVDAKWETDGDAGAQCGAVVSGDKPFKYKRINVTVRWEGMRPGTSAVRSDTLIAPNSRVNNPALGSIVIQVTNEFGIPQAGIASTTSVDPQEPNDAVPVDAQGLATDANGCSYVLKVVPGTYLVKVSKTGFVDTSQTANTSQSLAVSVAAGGAVLAPFVFDNGALVTASYPTGPTTMMPTNMQTTYSTTFGETTVSGNPTRVFPFGSGYQVIAGTLSEGACKSPDPAAWPVRFDGAVASRSDPVTIAPGSAASIAVPMGQVSVTKSGMNNGFLTAEIVRPAVAGGDPGCATSLGADSLSVTKYTFNKPAGTTAILNLPYGTYKLYYSTTFGATPTGSSGALTGTPFKADGTPSGLPASQTVTLDPRIIP